MRNTLRDLGLLLLAAGLLMPTLGVVLSMVRLHRAIQAFDPHRLEGSLPVVTTNLGTAMDPCRDSLLLAVGMMLSGIALLVVRPAVRVRRDPYTNDKQLPGVKKPPTTEGPIGRQSVEP